MLFIHVLHAYMQRIAVNELFYKQFVLWSNEYISSMTKISVPCLQTNNLIMCVYMTFNSNINPQLGVYPPNEIISCHGLSHSQ